jgi:hypothetical protein
MLLSLAVPAPWVDAVGGVFSEAVVSSTADANRADVPAGGLRQIG